MKKLGDYAALDALVTLELVKLFNLLPQKKRRRWPGAMPVPECEHEDPGPLED